MEGGDARLMAPKKVKKPYVPPKLVLYGTLAELTKKHGGVNDGKGGSGIVG